MMEFVGRNFRMKEEISSTGDDFNSKSEEVVTKEEVGAFKATDGLTIAESQWKKKRSLDGYLIEQ